MSRQQPIPGGDGQGRRSPPAAAGTPHTARAHRRSEPIGWLGRNILHVALAVGCLGALSYFLFVQVPRDRRDFLAQVEQDMSLRSEMRCMAVDLWLEEGLQDAQVFAALPPLRDLLRSRRGDPVDFPLSRQEMVVRLTGVLTTQGGIEGLEAVHVVDGAGRLVVASVGADTLQPDGKLAVRRVLEQRQPWISIGSHRDGRSHVVFAVPISEATDEPDRDVPLGIVLIHQDAVEWLYPFMGSALTTWKTGEALLARQEGDSIQFLSPLRFSADAPLERRVPASTDLATWAALRDPPGFGRFRDYRGEPVFAAHRWLETAPWGVVVKVDQGEVLGEFARRARAVGVAWGLAILAFLSTLAILWRQVALRRQVGAERALRSAEQRYRRLHESMRDAFVSVAMDGRILESNPAFQQMLGYSPEELASLTYVDITPERWHAQEERVVEEQILARGYSDIYEKEYRRKDGTVLPVELRTFLVRDDTGRPVEMWAIVRDISSRRQTETALRQSEARLRAVLHTIPDLIWLKDPEGIYLGCNPAFERLFGAPEAEIVGRTDHDFVSRELADFFRANDLKALAADRAMVNEEELTFAADGYQGSFETIKMPIRDVDGGIIGVLGIARDITLRRRDEEGLRTFSRIVQQSPVCVVLTDPEGAIEYVNPKFCEVTGYSMGEVLGQNPRILQSGLTPPEVYAELWRTIKAGGEWHGEFCNRRKDGRLYWEDATFGAIRDAAGTVTHLLAVKEDITARRQAEEALRGTQEQLLQSQKMEAIGRLAGGVAHDFNNLLSVIRGYSELALRRLLPADPARKTHETVRQAADRAAGLTRQLLAFSRRQVLDPKVVDLRHTLGEMEVMLRQVIGEDVELLVKQPAELGRVRIDPGQFEQVVMNLAVNARDAMPRGGTLRLELSETTLEAGQAREGVTMAPGPYVTLTVCDTGVGMDETTRAHIFEPFFTTKERGHGTGLGLATVYGIVKQSGGYIWVDSAPEKGTTFRIHLPRVDDPVDESRPVASRGEERGGGELILLLEDDVSVGLLARQILEEQGYRVLLTRDGDEAIRVAGDQGGEIALLLADVILPGLNGREVAERLRRGLPALRVLFMSGYTDDVIIRSGAGGAGGVLEPGTRLLQKPFTIESLLAAVREALRR
jgi:PAS domain S-box-containing protein